ncbi:unnamed protein product [Polarella glacialis]|uniref:Ionotropic glutamate receptor C-terminal domain-containing protein n=1 Tax=Polarella glacialis TaxID=89957 RepID=A0A813LAA3_POLGL|nr:unnamed protein product [Polarella glacialis]CAE8722722.1 unnamed protein product [Polarella glacialis]
MPPSLRLLWLALWPAVSQAARRRVCFGMIPFSMPPWSERDPQTGEYEGGFFVDFFREVGYEAGFDVEFVAITNPHYLDDFRGVTCKALDAGQIDLGWDPNTTADPGYLHTQPIVSFTNVVLTKRTHSPVSLWNIFLPFRFELWMTIAACILYGAVVLVLLKAIHEGDSSVWDCLRMCPSRLYYSAAAMLGGDDYDEYHNLPLGRLYRLGLLFLVLVSGATYTANLAAFLTKPNFEVHGPKTMEDLKHATVCTRYPTYASRIRRFVREVVEPPLNMSFPDRQPWAQEKLQNGECEAIVEVPRAPKWSLWSFARQCT